MSVSCRVYELPQPCIVLRCSAQEAFSKHASNLSGAYGSGIRRIAMQYRHGHDSHRGCKRRPPEMCQCPPDQRDRTYCSSAAAGLSPWESPHWTALRRLLHLWLLPAEIRSSQLHECISVPVHGLLGPTKTNNKSPCMHVAIMSPARFRSIIYGCKREKTFASTKMPGTAAKQLPGARADAMPVYRVLVM